MNPNLRCHSQEEFDQICLRLEPFVEHKPGHERIRLDRNNEKPFDTGPKACWLTRVVQWIKRIFSCNCIHPAVRIAERMLLFFEANSNFILPKHAVAIASIRKIKYAKIQNRRYESLKNVTGDTRKFSEAARRELQNEIANFEAEKARKQNELETYVVTAQDISRDLMQSAKQESSRILSDADDVVQHKIQLADKSRVQRAAAMENEELRVKRRHREVQDNIERVELNCRNLNTRTANEADTKCVEASQFYEKTIAKVKELIDKMRSEVLKQFDDIKNQAKKEGIKEIEASKEKAKKEANALIDKIKKDNENHLKSLAVELNSHVQERAFIEAQILNATEARDKAIAEAAQKCKEMLEKQVKECSTLKAQADQKIGEKERAASQRIDDLNSGIKTLKFGKQRLESKIHAVKEAPVTISCEGGEIPNVPYWTLERSPFFFSSLTWDQRKVTLADNARKATTLSLPQTDSKEKDAKVMSSSGSSAVAVPSKAGEEASKLSEKMQQVVDLKPHRIEIAKMYLTALERGLKLTASEKPEIVVELYVFAEYMGLTNYYGKEGDRESPDKDHEILLECLKYFGQDFVKIAENRSFILKMLAQGNLSPKLQSHFVNLVIVDFANFANIEEINQLNHETFLSVLKDGQKKLSESQLRSLIIRWFAIAGGGHVDRHGELLHKKINGSSIWQLCFSSPVRIYSMKGEIISALTDKSKFSYALAAATTDVTAKAKKEPVIIDDDFIECNVGVREGAKDAYGKKFTLHWGNMNLLENLKGESKSEKVFESHGVKYRVILRHQPIIHLYDPNEWYIYVESDGLRKIDFEIGYENVTVWTHEKLVSYDCVKSGTDLDYDIRKSSKPVVRAAFRAHEIKPFIRDNQLQFTITIRS